MGERERRGWVKMRHEEVWWRRKRRHGGHVVSASLSDVERRSRLSFSVLLLFIPHRDPWAVVSSSPPPGALANHADALYRLDGFPSKWSVRVPQSLDGRPFSVGGHQRLDAVVLALLPVWSLLVFPLLLHLPILRT